MSYRFYITVFMLFQINLQSFFRDDYSMNQLYHFLHIKNILANKRKHHYKINHSSFRCYQGITELTGSALKQEFDSGFEPCGWEID